MAKNAGTPSSFFWLLTVFSLAFIYLSVPDYAACATAAANLPAARSDIFIFRQQEREAGRDHPTHLVLQPLWQRVLRAEKVRPSFTANGDNFNRIDAESWRNLVQAAKNMQETAILQMVNGYFNQWLPKSDSNAWSTPEYWDTPREFINHRGGDCEDYAIAKYFALRFLGFEETRMRVVIVRLWDEKGKAARQLHAVLAVHCNHTWFVLDNNARPRDNIFPHTQYHGRFEALYSINESGAWLHGSEIARTSVARTSIAREAR